MPAMPHLPQSADTSPDAPSRNPLAPEWLSAWIDSYLLGCGIPDSDTRDTLAHNILRDGATVSAVDLVAKLHEELAQIGQPVAAMAAAAIPEERPGAMPPADLRPVWSPTGRPFAQPVPVPSNGG